MSTAILTCGFIKMAPVVDFLNGLAPVPLGRVLGQAVEQLRIQGDPVSLERAGRLETLAQDGSVDFASIQAEPELLRALWAPGVHALLRRQGDQVLAEVLDETPYLDEPELMAALEDCDDQQRVAILEAMLRQVEMRDRVVEQDLIPMEIGALAHSGGDMDAVVMALLAQAYSLRDARQGSDSSQGTFMMAVMSRPRVVHDTDARGQDVERLVGGVDAVRYTAGRQKRHLPLHGMRVPYRTTALPLECLDAVVGRFALHVFTPTAQQIESAMTSGLIAKMCTGALLVYGPKSFSQSGQDVDQWMEHVCDLAARPDIGTGFLAGYTGAKAVLQKRLPELDGTGGARGLDLGLGVNHLQQGLALASLLTGVAIEDAEIKTLPGGANIHVFTNLAMPISLRISVYDDADLRRTQRLFAIYKNVYSCIIFKELYAWIWHALEQNGGELSDSIVRDAECRHAELMQESEVDIVKIITEVEGMDPDKAVVLGLSLKDARESWRVKKMPLLIQLIRNLFFASYEKQTVEGIERWRLNSAKVRIAIDEWLAQVTDAVATRNPVAGISVPASRDAVRYGLATSLSALRPKDMTFEAMTTLSRLLIRLSADQIERMPNRMKTFIAEARQMTVPQVIPPEIREDLADLAGFIAKAMAGRTPSAEEAHAFFHEAISQRTLTGSTRWKVSTAEFFLQAVDSLKKHLQIAMSLIDTYGPQHAKLAAPYLSQMKAMVTNMDRLLEATRRANGKKVLQPTEIRMLLVALKGLLGEGDRIYVGEEGGSGQGVGESFAAVMTDLGARMALIFAYLDSDDRSGRFPYPTGYGRFLEVRPQ